MTLIDAILVLTCGLAFARWPMSSPAALLAVVVVAALAVMLEGWRTPLAPAYAVCAMLLIAALLPLERLPQWLQWLGLGGGLALLAASIAGCIILPLRIFPPSTGHYATGTAALPGELLERFMPKATPSQPRPAPAAHLWYPIAPAPPQSWIGQQFFPRDRQPAVEGAAVAAAPAQFPVVVYFGGWPGTDIQNLVLIRELVSRGFVVISMIYPGRLPSTSDAEYARQLADFQAPYDYSTLTAAKRTMQLFDDRVRHGAEDAAAMLNLLAAVNDQGAVPEFRGRLAVDRAGVLGFSMGGGVAAQAGWLEPRFKAVVNLDGRHWDESLEEGVPRHYLYVSEILYMPTAEQLASTNVDWRINGELDTLDYTNLVRNLERHGGVQVTISGMEHSNFTDSNLRSPLRRFTGGGSINRFRALEIVNAYVGSFFEQELQGTPQTLLDGNSSRFPEATVKVWPAPAAAPGAGL